MTLLQPFDNFKGNVFQFRLIQLEDAMRLVQRCGETSSLQRPAFHFPDIEDDRGIAVVHVAFGALAIAL